MIGIVCFHADYHAEIHAVPVIHADIHAVIHAVAFHAADIHAACRFMLSA